MARPSNLTEKQWVEVSRRRALGETVRGLAKEFGVSPASISGRTTKTSETLKTVANQLFEAEAVVRRLPILEQVAVRSLSERLLAVSMNLVDTVEISSRTALKLATAANIHAETINVNDDIGTQSIALASVVAMTRASNEAAEPGLKLLALNRDMLKSGDDGNTMKIIVVNEPEIV